MNDITEYSDDELSLIVFNDEGLYLDRAAFTQHDAGYLPNIIKYTDEQYKTLIKDISDDANEL